MRDDFSDATKRAIAQRVSWRCSRCGAVTAGPTVNPEKALNVGVAAHVTGASPGGPRFDAAQSNEQRRSAENGIWLCQTCAKLVDNDPNQFPVSLLRRLKADAELAALHNIGITSDLSSPDRDELWVLLKKYRPNTSAEFLFREGYEALASADPDLKYDVAVEADGITLSVRSRNGEPISVSFDPIFSDSEDDRIRAAAFERFLHEGTPVELDAVNIPVEDLPTALQRAIRSRGQNFRLKLGPKRPRTLVVAIRFETADAETYEFPYIEFGSNSFDGEAVVLSNEQQPVPFKIEERLYPDGGAEMDWSVDLNGRTVWHLREFFRFQKVLALTARTTVRTLDDGIEHIAVLRTPPRSSASAISTEQINFIDRVVAVQQATKIPIVVPNRPFPRESDLRALALIESIISTGRQPYPPAHVSLTIGNAEGLSLIRDLNDGRRPLAQEIPMHSELLLDTLISLGPVQLFCSQVVPHPDDQGKVERLLAYGDATFPVEIRFVAACNCEIEICYPKWVSKV